MNTPDLTLEALRAFHHTSTAADDLLEACLRDRLSLCATLERFLPALGGWLGAKGLRLTTLDEQLAERVFTWGEPVGEAREGRGCARVDAGDTSLWQTLDLAGVEVGRITARLAGDRTGERETLEIILDAACEELDAVLATVQTAAHKQRLILEVTEKLTNPVFGKGVDGAVATLHREIHLPWFALLYRDEIEVSRFHYRLYREGALVNDSEEHPHAALEAALEAHDAALIDPGQPLLRDALGLTGGVESLLISGVTRSEWLGKVVYTGGEHGFSTFGLDVVAVMCRAVSQRLVDFNRERRHLAQFFAPRVIGELLRDPHYHANYLVPREEQVAVLYADINSFTKISEQILERPPEIAQFVDRWSAGAVSLLWAHGGVFDKMVGDCIIGHFGPPFFRDTPAERARRAMKAARAISEFTAQLEHEIPWDRIPRSGLVPGLGVAIGVNLCPLSVGIFGPNRDYTGFSSGMNATARLQSLAGFRETLAMESLCDALDADGSLELGAITETPVKNVKNPLRYRKVTFK